MTRSIKLMDGYWKRWVTFNSIQREKVRKCIIYNLLLAPRYVVICFQLMSNNRFPDGKY